MKLHFVKQQVGGLTFYHPSCPQSKLIMALMGRGRKVFTQKQVKLMIKAGWEITDLLEEI